MSIGNAICWLKCDVFMADMFYPFVFVMLWERRWLCQLLKNEFVYGVDIWVNNGNWNSCLHGALARGYCTKKANQTIEPCADTVQMMTLVEMMNSV